MRGVLPDQLRSMDNRDANFEDLNLLFFVFHSTLHNAGGKIIMYIYLYGAFNYGISTTTNTMISHEAQHHYPSRPSLH